MAADSAIREILFFGISSGVISFTLSEMKIFEWLRKFIQSKSNFFGDLIHCFFCTGFWVSAVICVIYQPNLINQVNVLDHILTYFIVCGISGFTGLVFKVLFWVAERPY